MKLRKVHTQRLIPSSPFHFDYTFHKPDYFPSGDVHWEPGTLWQTWLWEDKRVGLKFLDKGEVDEPALIVEVYSQSHLAEGFLASLMEEVRYRYNLDLDLSDFYADFPDDSVLGPVIERRRGMRPGHGSSLYEYIIIGIVLQNATVRRSIQMLQTLFEKYGTALEFDGQRLWSFWPPGGLRGVNEEKLRELKVGYRAKSIKRVDDAFATGDLDELEMRDQDLETQKRLLLGIYGVGPATAGYLLTDVFHRWEFLEHISPWEQRIYSRLFFGRDTADPVPVDTLLAHFNQFGSYKQLAIHYVWEDLWWRREAEGVPWLEELIRR